MKLHRSSWAYTQGGWSLLKNLFYKKMETKKVADRRADICVSCVYNQFPDKDELVEAADYIAIASTGGKRAKHYDKLGNCMVCGCPLKAKVFQVGENINLTIEQIDKMSDVGCWQPQVANVKPGLRRQTSLQY